MRKSTLITGVIMIMIIFFSVNLFAEIDQNVRAEMLEITNSYRDFFRDSRNWLSKSGTFYRDMAVAEQIHQYIGWESPDWINDEKIRFSYDASGRLTTLYSSMWDEYSEDWYEMPFTLNFTWNENNLLTQVAMVYSDGEMTIDFMVINQTFNNNQQIISTQSWYLDEDDELELVTEMDFYYNAMGRVENVIMTDYEYMDYSQIHVTYDVIYRVESFYEEYSFDMETWYLDNMSFVVYHANDTSGYQDFQNFLNMGAGHLDFYWVPWAMFASETFYYWDGDSWVYEDRDIYTYDNQDRIVSRINEYYDGYESWIPQDKISFMYQTRSIPEEVREQYYDYFYEEWVDYSRWLITAAETSNIEENILQPSKVSIKNYPNPFNPETTIQFNLPVDQAVELIVLNIKGQKIRTLINEQRQAGFNNVVWDGKDGTGNDLSSGVYFYRLTGKNITETGKMLLLK